MTLSLCLLFPQAEAQDPTELEGLRGGSPALRLAPWIRRGAFTRLLA